MIIQEIREIIKLVDGSSIDEFIYETEGTKIKLKKNALFAAPAVTRAVPAVPVPPVSSSDTKVEQPVSEEIPEISATEEMDKNLHKIFSPMVGTFYLSPSPDEPAYVQTGSKVSAGQVICIVEAMKLFNEIEAEVDGEIAEILVKDGQLVEYGQPLFLVKAN